MQQSITAYSLQGISSKDSLKEQGFIVPKRLISTVWQTDEGLPHHSVIGLRQTRDGYLWLGTHEGLVRFDGMRFTVFNKQNTPAIKENSIERFWEDSHGRLWGETLERNPFYYDNGLFFSVNTGGESTVDRVIMTFFDKTDTLWISKNSGLYTTSISGVIRKILIPPHIRCDSITALAQDSSGRVWLAGRGTLTFYDKGTFGSVTLPKEIGQAPIKSMLVSRNNTIWFISGMAIVSYRASQWHIYAFSPTLNPSNLATSQYISKFPAEPRRLIFHDSQGRVWVRTLEGVYYFHEQIGWQPLTTAQGLLESDVYLMKEERNGALWLGMHNRGIQVWQNNVLQSITKENGSLSENSIRSLWIGNEGEAWVGTNNSGLHRLRKGNVQMLDKRGGLPMDKVFSLLQSRDGAFWVGTAGSGLAKFAGNTVQVMTKRDGLGEDVIRSLYEDNVGHLWVGTSGGGVQCVDMQKKRVIEGITEKNGLPHSNVYAIHQDKNGTMWFGTERGVVCRRFGTKALKVYSTENGLSFDRIRCFAEDSTGTLWIGTGHGLNKLVNGVITASYTASNGFPGNNRIFALYADKDTALWLGTFNSGLFRFKHGVFTQFSQAQGMFEDVVYGIVEDSQGYLWLSGNQGISRVSKQILNHIADGKGQVPISVESFTKTDGMNDHECNGGSTPSAVVLQSGHLAFPTLGGVAFLKSSDIQKNSVKPIVHIEEVFSDTIRLAPTLELEGNQRRILEHTVQNIEFHYTAISMLAPERVQCKYMLEGYDKSWVNAGNRRVAYYTNLSPGTYKFRVIACNNDGAWNIEGAVFSFQILSPWWASWWAWGLYGVSFLVLSFVVLRYRDRRQRKKVLAEQREREAEIVRRKNAELEEANRELRLLNEEKNEFLGIAAHDLKNPLGIINIIAELLLNDAGRVSDEDRMTYLKTITSSSERMFDIIKNLLDINTIEQGALSLRVTAVPLEPIVSSLVEVYRSRAELKNIMLTFSSDSPQQMEALIDEQALTQVVDNLISNAVKYSPHGKNVYVRVLSSPSVATGHLSVNNANPPIANAEVNDQATNNQCVRVEVQDEGPGISADDMKKLFGKFARLSARPTGGEHSTGLGLSIVKKMVEAMNGRVWCESELGKGATFIVELPLVST